MTTFIEYMQNHFDNNTLTNNGALSNKFIDPSLQMEGTMGLFYKTVRNLDTDVLQKYLNKAANEDIISAIQLAFHIRDCRGGKAERELGKKCLRYFAQNYTVYFNKVLELIPEYGRWDDLVYFTDIPDVKENI